LFKRLTLSYDQTPINQTEWGGLFIRSALTSQIASLSFSKPTYSKNIVTLTKARKIVFISRAYKRIQKSNK